MRVIHPIVRRFRTQLQAFGTIPISLNWLYRRVLWLLQRANCLLRCLGSVRVNTATVTDVASAIRVANPLAKLTKIQNYGANRALILENGVYIATCPAGEMITLPMPGRLALSAHCATGLSTSLRITTFERCLCGDDQPPYDSNTVPPVPDVTTIIDVGGTSAAYYPDVPANQIWELIGEWTGVKRDLTLRGHYAPFSIDIYTDEAMTAGNRILNQEEGLGLSTSTAAKAITFETGGSIFTGTIRRTWLQSGVDPDGDGNFTTYKYTQFRIHRQYEDLI